MFKGEKRQRDDAALLLERQWDIIEESIYAILAGTKSRYSFQSTHQAVYRVCQEKQGRLFFEVISDALSEYSSCLAGKFPLFVVKPAPLSLAETTSQVRHFSAALHKLDDLLLFFTRSYLPSYGYASVWELGAAMFLKHFLKKPETIARIVEELQQVIVKSDTGEQSALVFADFMRELRSLLKESQLAEVMTVPYLSAVRTCYASEIEAQFRERDIGTYLSGVVETCGREIERCNEMSCGFVAKPLENQFINDCFSSKRADISLLPKLKEWDLDAVVLLVSFYLLDDTAAEVVSTIAKYWIERCESILSAPAVSADAIVEQMNKVLDDAATLSKLFRPLASGTNEQLFLRSITGVASESRTFIPAITAYYDYRIREVSTPEACTELCAVVLRFLAIVDDRDKFETSFRDALAARLLFFGSQKLAQEKMCIEEIKNACGAPLVGRMLSMISDIEERSDEKSKFLQYAASRGGRDNILDFDVMVLNGGFWPVYTNVVVAEPRAIREFKNQFGRCYTEHHSGRKLAFQMALGTVVYELTHKKKTYTITAPTPYTQIFEFLNQHGDSGASVAALRKYCATSLESSQIDGQVQALASAQIIIHQKGEIRFNENFESSRKNINILALASDSSKASGAQAVTDLQSKNEYARQELNLDSSLIRAIKQSVRVDLVFLCHTVTASVEHLFTPTPAAIKRRLEELIKKGIVRREPNDHFSFVC